MPPVAQHIITPAAIRATYAGFVLSNGVRCVIVQDENAKMPAAAMSIHAGQLNDPVEVPGLAHFCEHMLFMGTEKYPKEDEFDHFVSKASGMTNAFTADCDTVYYFSVSEDNLDGALERFVEFFAAPNFSPGAVAREVNAVHSEDEKNHNNDYWRLDELIRNFYHPKHPRSRYGNGNVTTLRDQPQALGIDVRERLKDFHERYYVAEGATMMVVSPRSPEEILHCIEGPLSRMKSGPAPFFSFLDENETLFSRAALGSWTNLRTVRKLRELRFMWGVRSPSSSWRSTPSAYISHLLGHECNTSVLGVLKQRDWATAMVAGAHRIDDDFEMFDVSITLTVTGFKNVLEVMTLVYSGIGVAIANGVDAAVFEQMKAEERLFFECSSIGSAAQHCVALAMNANATDLEHCWIGGDVVLEDDVEATLRYAQQLTPSNCVVVMQWGDMPKAPGCSAGDEEDLRKQDCQVTPAGDTTCSEGSDSGDEGADDDDEDGSEGDEEVDEGGGDASIEELFSALPAFAQVPVSKVLPIHKAVYETVPIPEALVLQWHNAIGGPFPPALSLPSTNPFICTDFTVYPPVATTPTVEEMISPHAVTYVRKDAGRHHTFKTALRCTVLSPVAYASPLNRLYTRVMHGILSNAITETAYYAALASLANEVVLGATGLGFAIDGPSQKMFDFFFSIVTKALSRDVLQGTEEAYKTYLEASIRSLKNEPMKQPYVVLLGFQKKAVHHTYYLFDEILACESAATYASYRRFVTEYIERGLFLECFVAGNISSAEHIRNVFVQPLEELLTSLNVFSPPKESIPRVRDTYGLREGGVKGGEEVISGLDVISVAPFNVAEPNVAVLLDIALGESTSLTKALANTAMRLLSSAFFNALRTREALGYTVAAHSQVDFATVHALFIVQSALPDVDCLYLLSRILAFFEAVEAQLDAICNADDVETVKQSLIASLEKLPDSVEDDAAQLEGEYLDISQFESKARTIAAVRAVSEEDVRKFLRSHILNRRTATRALALCIHNARTAPHNVFLQPGERRLSLPSARPNQDGDKAPSDPEDASVNLSLPAFGRGSSCIEIVSFASATEYHQGLPVLRSTTY